MTSPKEAVRVAIAGASSLLGKELALWLEETHFPAIDIRLVDEEFVAGTLTEAGGEPAIIETVTEETVSSACDSAFRFTGSPEFSEAPCYRRRGAPRRSRGNRSGAADWPADANARRLWIPTLDAVLASPSTERPSPWREPAKLVSRSFHAARADAAISISEAWRSRPPDSSGLVMTALQPVSERGTEAIEELESQVVKLLSFQPVSQTVFDAQVGFNMLSSYGPESTIKLADARTRIAEESRRYLVGRAPVPAIMLVQAPVFYSHTFTAYAEFKSATALGDLTARLVGAGLRVVGASDEPPTNGKHRRRSATRTEATGTRSRHRNGCLAVGRGRQPARPGRDGSGHRGKAAGLVSSSSGTDFSLWGSVTKRSVCRQPKN